MIGFQFFTTYATTASVWVVLRDVGTSNIKTTPTLAAGDFQVSKDGGAWANLATLPVEYPAAGGGILLQLSSSELTCKVLNIRAVDQTTPKEWDDGFFTVITLGDINAFNPFMNLSPASVWQQVTVTNYGAGSIGNFLTSNLDVAVSSRLAAASYILPATSGQIATQVWDTPVPGSFASGRAGYILGTNLDALISSRLAALDYTSPPTTGQIQTAVQEGLTAHGYTQARGVKLDMLDVAVSSRLASGSYVTPLTSGQVSAAVWDVQLSAHLQPGTTGVKLATTMATGESISTQLDMTQAVPMVNGLQTVGDALNAALSDGFGRWEIVGRELRMYARDGQTIVRTFQLNNSRAPTSRQ